MTVRCTVCGENFKAWSDREDMCEKCKVFVEDERRQAETERTCPQCGAVLPVGSKGVFCSKKCRTASYEKTRRAMKCAICGADMSLLRRKYCSDSCRKKGEKIKAGKAAVKSDGFAEFEKASIDAMKRGERLTYGRFMAQKMTEGA